jgi:arginase family enzyme
VLEGDGRGEGGGHEEEHRGGTLARPGPAAAGGRDAGRQRSLVRLDFDGSPAPDLPHPVRTIDLSDVVGTRYATEDDTFARLAARLEGEDLDAVLLGSGDFHHHALHALRRKREPFSLVLFDNHADLGPSDLITCGAWVEDALSLPALAAVLLVGCMPSTLVGLRSPLDRVVWTPLDNDVVRGIRTTVPLRAGGLREALDALPTRRVHVSIDKDVLHPDDATTGWSHGGMRLEELVSALDEVGRQCTVESFDLCGDAPLSPVERLTPAGVEVIARNNRADRAILDQLVNAR